MKTFYCDSCGSLVFFENVHCVKCNGRLGFLPDLLDVSTLKPGGNTDCTALIDAANSRPYRLCQNQVQHEACNWLLPAGDPNALCQACRLNETIPDLNSPANLELWRRLERAKRRLLYTLLKLGLPLGGAENRPALRFSFKADPPGGPRILTGHAGGLITVNVAEADDVLREQNRVSFHEPYRTLVGHFRHEIAHFYWDQLIRDTPRLEPFRQLFGDDTRDYPAALNGYYATGPAPDWQSQFVSAYASAHPWEDWAETWAHYLHIRDTLETAGSFGMTLKPRHPDAKAMTAEPGKVKGQEDDFDHVLRHWLPLTYAINELNRGMGLPDIYPFVLSAVAINKLRFVHEVITETGRRSAWATPRSQAGKAASTAGLAANQRSS